MTEAFAIAPEIINGTTPVSSSPKLLELPRHLTRETLQQIQKEKGEDDPELIRLWGERGALVERKVQSILSTQTDIVSEVIMNPEPDTQGSDLTVFFKDGFPVNSVRVEVKSSHLGTRDFKHKIRDTLPPNEQNSEGIHNWMTDNKIILINGGEKDSREKTPEEILQESFYPQLERIIEKALEQREEPIQIFPAS